MRTIERTRDQDLIRHASTHAPVSTCPLTEGNDIKLLPSGADTIAAMFTALADARDHIHLEYYIIEDVHWQGRTLQGLLLDALQRGVKVAIIYDSVGSIGTPDAFFDRLSQAGARTLEFHPVNPMRRHFAWHLNDRDHRKIMVIDGATAFLGGVNLSRVYENPPEAGTPRRAAQGYWHDCAVRIRGPVVAQAQSLFLDTWNRNGGDPLDAAEHFPTLGAEGDQIARNAGSLPHERQQLYFEGMQAAIRTARHRIWLTTGYFVPARREWQMLADAARRGVEVDLILAGYSDVRGALHAARALYGRLLTAGVRIHEMTDGFLHAKAATIDGVWTIIGSSNFDRRSYAFNNEVDAVILGRDTAADVEALLEGWMHRAQEVTLRTWRNRSLHEHVAELSARVWERYM